MQYSLTDLFFYVTDFITTKKYPKWTEVHRIVEGAETAPFKQYFATWRDQGMSHSRLIRAANDNGKIRKTHNLKRIHNVASIKFTDSETNEGEEFDPSILHKLQKSGGRALGFMPDNGDGEVEMWRIENFELVPVDPETSGMFFGGDSYVIKYHYANKRGGQGYVIYYWQVKFRTLFAFFMLFDFC